MYEPDIFQTTRRFGTILENVDLDPATRELDLDSERFTENTRGAYPLEFIGNADPTGIAGQPRNVVLLTADAFGVLPPISRLTHDQAAYHFISGYTAKLAGTEIGVKEPKATFSACFGAPFMPRHPGEYARDAGGAARAATTCPVWLVNTGWTGGPYGTGERMNIDHTRAMVRAALSGAARRRRRRVDRSDLRRRPSRPPARTSRPSSSSPRNTWPDRAAYDRGRRPRSPGMFADNFEAYADGVEPRPIVAAGPAGRRPTMAAGAGAPAAGHHARSRRGANTPAWPATRSPSSAPATSARPPPSGSPRPASPTSSSSTSSRGCRRARASTSPRRRRSSATTPGSSARTTTPTRRARDIVVVTSGLARQPGMSRDDLLAKNAGIVKAGRRAGGEPRRRTRS